MQTERRLTLRRIKSHRYFRLLRREFGKNMLHRALVAARSSSVGRWDAPNSIATAPEWALEAQIQVFQRWFCCKSGHLDAVVSRSASSALCWQVFAMQPPVHVFHQYTLTQATESTQRINARWQRNVFVDRGDVARTLRAHSECCLLAAATRVIRSHRLSSAEASADAGAMHREPAHPTDRATSRRARFPQHAPLHADVQHASRARTRLHGSHSFQRRLRPLAPSPLRLSVITAACRLRSCGFKAHWCIAAKRSILCSSPQAFAVCALCCKQVREGKHILQGLRFYQVGFLLLRHGCERAKQRCWHCGRDCDGRVISALSLHRSCRCGCRRLRGMATSTNICGMFC
jgi:hypothetical protein